MTGEPHTINVLFFSTMVVSPVTGGGNAAFNLLESGISGSGVYYATPIRHPPEWPPFPAIGPRICRFNNVNRSLP